MFYCIGLVSYVKLVTESQEQLNSPVVIGLSVFWSNFSIKLLVSCLINNFAFQYNRIVGELKTLW